jgi:hypothetical protein
MTAMHHVPVTLTSAQVSAERSGAHVSHVALITVAIYAPVKALVIADTDGYIRNCRLVGHSGGGGVMNFLIQFRETLRRRRERIKRLNAARYARHASSGIEPMVHAHHREDKGWRQARR